ncbi:hypothetical protein [Clostridioides difficile]|uniref:hypothetical protein n=1 Tax=Clostridioides difficile TaxID=1496 RepID=UPI00163ABE00|nr:hypothetical protein [Clostridioides difficile]
MYTYVDCLYWCSYDYCDFIDTQLDDFILEYGENVVESCLHQVMVLVSKYN